MEKRDLIQAEIEKLGFFLQRLLSNFLKTNSLENSSEAISSVTNELKNELDFDLSYFVSLSDVEMKKYLSIFNFNENHIEQLADLLAEMRFSKLYLTRSLELLDLVDEYSNSFSFERNSKKTQIQQLLNQ